MKILLINTSDNTGGAAVAAMRLMDALTRSGASVKMLVRDKGTADARVVKVRGPWWKRALDAITPGGSWCKAVERVMLLPHSGWSWRRSWTIDGGILGTDVTRMEEFREADVIHLHWVNQGMLSLSDLRRIFRSGKRIVWTMHDLWAASSIYHYSTADAADDEDRATAYARRIWKKKFALYHPRSTHRYPLANNHLTFVACSEWLARQARGRKLMAGQDIVSIPNPIDTLLYNRGDRKAARAALSLPTGKKIVLFVSQRVTDERKGARYFIEAINALRRSDICVAILGSGGDEVAGMLQCDTKVLGYLTDQSQIVQAYNAADVFVLPSLNDNLPNTIMEAMACGVPSVAFSIGGIPEMISHEENGYLAAPRDAEALAEGISYCLDDDNRQRLSDACLSKVATTYSQQAVAERFMSIYAMAAKSASNKDCS